MRVEFVDELPAKKRAPGPGAPRKYTEFARLLAERPGEWAVFPKSFNENQGARAYAYNVKRGVLSDFPRGEFEAAARDGVLYVRYVGGVA